jgi:hypothetical protein
MATVSFKGSPCLPLISRKPVQSSRYAVPGTLAEVRDLVHEEVSTTFIGKRDSQAEEWPDKIVGKELLRWFHVQHQVDGLGKQFAQGEPMVLMVLMVWVSTQVSSEQTLLCLSR